MEDNFIILNVTTKRTINTLKSTWQTFGANEIEIKKMMDWKKEKEIKKQKM